MKLAVITTHPIQYYAPWFRRIVKKPAIQLKVFYLWDFGIRSELADFRRFCSGTSRYCQDIIISL